MLPASILLIANSVLKSTRSIQSGTTVTKKSIIRQSSPTLGAWSQQGLPRSPIQLKATLLSRGSCEDTGLLCHRHEFQSSFGSLAGRKKDEAIVPVSTCSMCMPASSSSTRRPRRPRRSNGSKHICFHDNS